VHYTSLLGDRVQLELLSEETIPKVETDAPTRLSVEEQRSPVVRAAQAHFKATVPEPTRRAGLPALPLFREQKTGLLKTVYRELVVRFNSDDVSERTRRSILAKHKLQVRRTNAFVPDQVIVAERSRKVAGADLLDVANDLADMEEVRVASPNFVSEYRREAVIAIPAAQWHLRNRGRVGQSKGEDVNARGAWNVSRGKRSVIVAVLDDGVDLEHPNLRGRLWGNRDNTDPDSCGRDFFIPDDHPDHFNPRPKRFRFPFDQLVGNDIHGTPCAGVVAAAGRDAWGIAHRCLILAVKVFHADDLAADERVADAIRYSATRAAVLSCSWSGGRSPDIEAALEDIGNLGRNGLGSPLFAATGNDHGRPVAYPASDPNAIAVGASTDQAKIATYSNVGSQTSVVAPSSGGAQGVYTTDVSLPNRGFSVAAGPAGHHTATFGGTSSATPLAAGIGALVLSVKPKLRREEVKEVLQRSAHKIGSGYDANGHSNVFGFGRVDARAAVELARRWPA
jgi:subtilisin family serine protease